MDLEKLRQNRNETNNFLRHIVAGDPLTAPKKIIATSRELKRGKRVLFYEVDVTADDGRLLCSGQFTIMPLDMKIEL